MVQRTGGLYAGVALFGIAALVGGWFTVGSMFAASGDAAVAASEWAPSDVGPAVPVPPLGATAAPPETSRAAQSIDQTWASQTSSRTGVPERALSAYAAAELVLATEQPACSIGWNTLAGIGHIETHHGSYGGAVLQVNGDALPRILGPALDGNGFAEIRDTDAGVWDSDGVWDRAVGPMQFIPGTWTTWGADGNGDGRADPNNIDDAALAAGRYLCASGSMSDAAGWRAAVFSYNHLDSYVDDVARAANDFAAFAANQ